MIDRGIIAFYNDDMVELRQEFKDEFNRLTEKNEEGLYTFLFSSYHEYMVTTEIVFCMIYEDTALFFVTPYAMQLSLDNNLMVKSGDIYPNGQTFETLFAEGDNSSVVHIGECCNSKGYAYGIYSFGYKRALAAAIEMVNNETYDIEQLIIDDQDLIDVSIDYLEVRIQKFQDQVDKSHELEEPVEGLDENPYSNAYYDNEGKPLKNNPLTQVERLGDGNV